MSYLVYCLMKAPAVSVGQMTGMMGKTVSFVTAHGLAAAVSELAAGETAPPVSELLAYSKVVEGLHHMRTVIPMRYGCFLESLSALHLVLEEKKSLYETLLQKLEGCDEMGIRILFDERAVPSEPELQPTDGTRYLALRRTRYQMQVGSSQQNHVFLEGYLKTFSGLYVNHRIETATRTDSVNVSLYFLVPKSQVPQFRETFQRVGDLKGAKTLLSGPWPPYNFSAPEFLPSAGLEGAH